MIISIPPEYGLSEKTELKKCIEKANLNVLKMIATPVAKVICIEEKKKQKLNSLKPDNKINENLKSGNLLIDLDSGTLLNDRFSFGV